MAGLSDFSDSALNDGVDVANLPREGRGGTPPPPMGPYVFALSPLELKNFGKSNSDKHGERVYVNFNQDAPLVIKQDVGGKHVGEPVRALVNNTPRPRGRGEDAPQAADWDYLNVALGVNLEKRTNRAYVESLIAKSKTRAEFGANVAYQWQCDPKRDAYFEVPVPEGAPEGTQPTYGPQPDPNNSGQNIKGCGARFYPGEDWKQAEFDAEGKLKKQGSFGKTAGVEGGYDYRGLCQNCGALLRANVNLENYRKAGNSQPAEK